MKTLTERFWSKVNKEGPVHPDLGTRCWPWTGYANPRGDGEIGSGGRDGGTLKARHVAWELTYGPIPDGLSPLQKCENRLCVNPAHLFLRMVRGTLAERFWAKVDKNGPLHPVLGTRCWVWTGATRHGYGAISIARCVAEQTHRVAWELENGPIPEELHVLHQCDNRPCVRPAHLFLGTEADNIHDMWAKGRAADPPGTQERRAQTQCLHGHVFDSANTGYRKGRNGRYCLTCKRRRALATYQRNRGVHA